MELVAFIIEREDEHSREQRIYCSTLNFKIECLKSVSGTRIRAKHLLRQRFFLEFQQLTLSIMDQVKKNEHRL